MNRSGTAIQRAQARHSASGFTLVELMIVVVIIMILGGLAVYGVRKYIVYSHTAEPIQMIGGIKAAQEAYKAETFSYKDISGSNALTDYSTYFPRASLPGREVMKWEGGDPTVLAKWNELGVKPSSWVRFTYGCAAGDGTIKPADPGDPKLTPDGYPTSPDGQPWFLVKAAGNLEGGTSAPYIYAGTSYSAAILGTRD